MQVSDINDVKIYNLSSGKSLPEWLSERKRRALLKKDVDLRRRIELIQDFDMPDLSNAVKVTPDGQYILATGIYKPRVKCFDVNNLSQKFDRCFDSEAITFEILSDDFSKLVFLQTDRYLEFHAAHGRYYRLRIPRYGRDMKLFSPTAELFIVGVSPDIYRLNLERGQFMTPFTTQSSMINKCAVNKPYSLFMCGTNEGKVECWDPRCRSSVGILDCAFSCVNETKRLETFPSITALNFDGPLHMGVGTSNGLVLLYDIRSNKPYLIKDHMEELPILDIEFNNKENLVFSMNKSILKLWDKNSAKPYASIETTTEFNNLCVVPETGLLFIANEKPKLLTYYIPSIGPAPKWASFLDSLTEELEESNVENIYDDYKFVTKNEVAALGLDLDHLIKNNLLRAYMHGYFMDARLYRKAKLVSQPFAFEEYRKRKIKETIESERGARIKVDNLPQVNKELALKFMDKGSKTKKTELNLINDDRFKNLFLNPDYQIDQNSEEFRLINPVLSKMESAKQKKMKRIAEEEEDGESEGESIWEDTSEEDTSEEVMREPPQKIKNNKEAKIVDKPSEESVKNNIKENIDEIPLGERREQEDEGLKVMGSSGNREMTFSSKRKRRDGGNIQKAKQHFEERKAVFRKSVKGMPMGKTRSYF